MGKSFTPHSRKHKALASSLDDVKQIGDALADRFGPRPKSTDMLLALTELRCLAESRALCVLETEGPLLKMLKATGIRDDYVKLGPRFPRLEKTDPVKKIAEIKAQIKRLPEA